MPEKHHISSAKIQRYYRPLLSAFIVVSLVIVGVIVYFSFSRTIITVTAKAEPVDLSVAFTVYGSATAPATVTQNHTAVPGVILQHTQKLKKSYTDLTTLASVPAKAAGTITIYNKNNKVQPLVAGTRLVSDGGKLFRTTERVDVPVNGSVAVDVIADQVGKDYEIAPSHFILPGLWPGLQDKIYGESATAMSGGTTDTKVATINDIQIAKEAARSEMYDQGINELNSQIKKINADWNVSATRKEIVTEDVSVEPDQATSTIEVSSSMNILGIAFDAAATERQLLELAEAQISAEDSFSRNTDKAITYTIERYDVKTNTAEVKALVNGSITVKLTNPMFDRKNLVNKDRQEISSYFSRFKEIDSAEVRFSPFWVIRAPSLPDHIEVRLKLL